MPGTRILLIGLAAGLLLGATQDPIESPIPDMSDSELANGQRLFTVHCARCHGMLGGGGEGPSLQRPKLRHAPDDDALFDVLDSGIRGTGMPGTFGPNEREIWQIAGYVRSLGQLPAEALPGNPANGRSIYETRGACASCHILAGSGRGVGPELSEVGLRRNAEYLRRALTNPDADYPMLNKPMTGRTNAFLTVRLVTKAGEFEGMRVNEDEFSIQLRDLTGKLHSFDKADLLSFEKAVGHSLMPGYAAVLEQNEVNDLVAYLMTLGKQQ